MGPPPNTLDLVFSNVPKIFHTLETEDMTGTSDHNLVNFNTEFSVKLPETSRPMSHSANADIRAFNFPRANKEALKEALVNKRLDMIAEQAPDPIEAKSAVVEAIVEAAKEAKVPLFQHTKQGDHSAAIRKLYKERVAILRRMRKKRLSTTELLDRQRRLREIQAEVAETNRAEAEEKEKTIAKEIKTNPKRFYQYANSFRKSKTKIGPLKTLAGDKKSFESGPKKMAEILSAQYKSVFTAPKQQHPDIQPRDILSVLDDLDIDCSALTSALQCTPTWSAPGPDGITAFFIKTYAEEIAPAFTVIWQQSLDSGIMPDDVNLAFITPLFKGGDKSDPANYRPVALTNHTTKAFERLLKDEIVLHCTAHHFFNATQHGFTVGRSTLTNLIDYYESLLLLLEHHQYVDAIYLDYSKAFDKCDHDIILKKLDSLGIRGNINAWISAFLKRRQQVVVVQGVESSPVWVASGVPQGSVLGPLLFLILMIDITGCINHSALISFADDTKILKGITSAEVEVRLQDDLERAYVWAEQNNMSFN